MKFTLALAVFAPFVVAACSGDDTTGTPSDASTDSSRPDAGPTDAQPQDAPSPPEASTEAGGDAGPALSVIASFDAAQFQLAEGLVVHGGNAYVGLAPLGTILEIGPSGKARTYA